MSNPDIRAALERLVELAKRKHYYCEDTWYSCPKAEGGCANDSGGEDCNCGADIHNAKVEAAARAALAEPVGEGPTLKELSDWIYKEDSERSVFVYHHHDVLRIVLAALARWGRPAAPPAPEAGEVRYEFSLIDDDGIEQAGGSAPSLAQAIQESGHYRLMYLEDARDSEGPWRFEIREVRVLPAHAIPVPQAGEGEG